MAVVMATVGQTTTRQTQADQAAVLADGMRDMVGQGAELLGRVMMAV
jgi:hypothetical protein